MLVVSFVEGVLAPICKFEDDLCALVFIDFLETYFGQMNDFIAINLWLSLQASHVLLLNLSNILLMIEKFHTFRLVIVIPDPAVKFWSLLFFFVLIVTLDFFGVKIWYEKDTQIYGFN